MDCFAALAMTSRYDFAIPRRKAPGPCGKHAPQRNQRAQGMPDARCTRGLVCAVHKRTAHEHTGEAEASDIPCAMALRLIASSPRRPALLPPSLPRGLALKSLTPAPGRQDHTLLPYAL